MICLFLIATPTTNYEVTALAGAALGFWKNMICRALLIGDSVLAVVTQSKRSPVPSPKLLFVGMMIHLNKLDAVANLFGRIALADSLVPPRPDSERPLGADRVPALFWNLIRRT